MGTFVSIVVAAVIGVGLAVATTVGVVTASQQTAQNTQQEQKPLVVYGTR